MTTTHRAIDLTGEKETNMPDIHVETHNMFPSGKSENTPDFAKRDTTEGHGWIQWKGTEPCVDLHCTCGAHLHADESFFFYHFKCGECGQVWELGGHIKLHKVTDKGVALLEKNKCGGIPTLLDDH